MSNCSQTNTIINLYVIHFNFTTQSFDYAQQKLRMNSLVWRISTIFIILWTRFICWKVNAFWRGGGYRSLLRACIHTWGWLLWLLWPWKVAFNKAFFALLAASTRPLSCLPMPFKLNWPKRHPWPLPYFESGLLSNIYLAEIFLWIMSPLQVVTKRFSWDSHWYYLAAAGLLGEFTEMVEFSPGFHRFFSSGFHRFLRWTLVEAAALSSFTFIFSSFSSPVLFHLLPNFHFFKFFSFYPTSPFPLQSVSPPR